MSSPQIGTTLPEYTILVVDDEPDMLAVTRLALRGGTHGGRRLRLLTATSGQEAVAQLRANPDVAMVLIDVVMETDTAGLDACRTIRETLGNRVVRLVVRTGQPGTVPERQTIEDYDIDGYLSKAELTSTRLYATVRTALRAYDQLSQLERQRQLLTAVHDCVAHLRSFQPLENVLTRVLAAALALCSAPLGVLLLENTEVGGARQRHFYHQGAEASFDAADAVRMVINRARAAGGVNSPMAAADGWVLPIQVPLGLADGWLYVGRKNLAEIEQQALIILAEHAGNLLYSLLEHLSTSQNTTEYPGLVMA